MSWFVPAGIPMVAHGGIYLLNIVDVSCGGFPMLFCALAEVIVLNWVYGYDQFAEDVELMLGKKPNLYWKVSRRFHWLFFGGRVA